MLSPGARLGPYEIVAPIGAGGMGAVFRARDTRLQRDVAIKVLAPSLAGDPDAGVRFEREAHSVAQLSHPNILAIHDVGREGTISYAVTELLEGETLRDLLARGALPVRKAIEYALQIARGLAAAHDRGIVHRDLKPENVFVTRDDRVKILDFGLAKPVDLPVATTVTIGAATAAGTVMGTFGYMAPEQVRAQPLDHRADIFSFGALLYEMLTARRAFAGDTPADTISAILHADPADVTVASGALPTALDRIVRRALEKKPELRFQSAHDLAFALDTLAGASGPHAPVAADARRPPRADRLAWRLAPWAVAVAAVGTAAWLWVRPPNADPAPLTRLDLALPGGVELHVFGGSMAIAPDGRSLAFVGVDGGVRQAYFRALDQPEARALKGTETAFRLFFSPDGMRLGAVVTDGTFRLLTLATGEIARVPERTDFFGATWTSADDLVFTRDRKLWRVKASGGAATAVPGDSADVQVTFPAALPDPDKVLVAMTTAESTDIAVVSLSTGERRTLVREGDLPAYAESGHILFLRGGSLVAAPFDARTSQVIGPAVPMMDGLPGAARAAAVAVSRTGTLVYAGAQALQSQLVWVTREGAERAVTKLPRQYANPRVSPDGRQLLVQTLSGELWIHDGERDTLSRLATPAPLVGFPIWLRDGREVAYKTPAGVHRLEVNGARHSQVPGTIPNDYPSAVSPDGTSLAVTRLTSATSADIYIVSLTGAHEPRQWLSTPTYDGGATWSPDGTLMAYGSAESGRSEVYLQPYPGPGVRRQVSIDGGGHPVWSRDGRELFFRETSRVYVVSVARKGDVVSLSQPKLLFDRLYGYGQGISIPNYDVSTDGRFAFVKDSGATRLNVILNWFTDLKERAR